MDVDIVNSKLQIENSLKRAIKELTDEEIEPEVVVQNDLNKGDFSTNVAMTMFARIKGEGERGKIYKTPMEFAEEIVKHLTFDIGHLTFIDRIEVKEPGFINFWLSEAQIIAELERVLASKNSAPQKSEVILEFGDLNPFKEPHIGHLRNLSLGESLARLMEWRGNKIIRANYEGDVGAHVAKAIWAIVNSKLQIAKIDEKSLEEKIRFLAQCYAKGAKAYEEDENAKAEIISINNKIYSNNAEVKEIWEKGRKWSLEYFETLYKILGTRYDKYYFESEVAPLGKKIVEENLDKVFEKDDGAIVFRGEKVGLHTRVFVTKEEYATYEGKDLALAVLKDKDFPKTKRSIIMTANEQIEYFKVMLAALKMVNPKIADKTSHLSFGFVNLKEGKM
ncbi:MAG: arginine--tRNA ligase, partial [Candidatus Levybacteria bacterium]|nr:arginine--tRNA ligase [Candidatus Levybacteria bacterium]